MTTSDPVGERSSALRSDIAKALQEYDVADWRALDMASSALVVVADALEPLVQRLFGSGSDVSAYAVSEVIDWLRSEAALDSDALAEVGGKPLHGYSCDCEVCP